MLASPLWVIYRRNCIAAKAGGQSVVNEGGGEPTVVQLLAAPAGPTVTPVCFNWTHIFLFLRIICMYVYFYHLSSPISCRTFRFFLPTDVQKVTNFVHDQKKKWINEVIYLCHHALADCHKQRWVIAAGRVPANRHYLTLLQGWPSWWAEEGEG